MANNTLKVRLFWMIGGLLVVSLLGGCVTLGGLNINPVKKEGKLERTTSSYEKEGEKWGKELWKAKITAASFNPLHPLSDAFINALINYIDFFSVHAELKDAFKKGFRIGYQDRTADLVLGPHLTEAAGRIGTGTSSKFVNVIETFEGGWAQTLRNAVDIFVVLITEGSQKDREIFINRFDKIYTDKYQKTRALLEAVGFTEQVTEGGTTLYIDVTKTVATLNIPKPETLKTEIYQQTFKVMGDEWGRRHSTNLIKRGDLVDLLRRSKTALQEVEPGLKGNLNIIRVDFVKSYGTDAENVFDGLLKEAGYL